VSFAFQEQYLFSVINILYHKQIIAPPIGIVFRFETKFTVKLNSWLVDCLHLTTVRKIEKKLKHKYSFKIIQIISDHSESKVIETDEADLKKNKAEEKRQF